MSWGVATQNGVSVSLASIVSLSCGATEFSPASLFTSGVAGAWYDPSDINNYTAGLGPELVTNGDFSGGSTGWTTTGTGWSIGSNIATHTGTVSGDLTQVCLTVGKTYKITATITGTGATVYLGDSTNLGLQTGSFSTIATCAGSTTLRFRCPYDAVTIDDISVKEVTTIANATLFQDSAGTTPVTAVEQPVGLMLDKSQGLVLGSELVTNGDFSGGTTGWSTEINTSIAVVSGELAVTNIGAAPGTSAQAISTVAGRWYAVTATARASTATPANIVARTTPTSGNIAFVSVTATTNTNVTLYFAASGSTTYIALVNNNNSGGVAYYDNISVKSLAGNHASQATAASRPVLRARYNLLTYSEQFDNAVWTKNSVTIAANTLETTDPIGGNTADKATLSAGTANKDISIVGLSLTSTVTYSAYFKASTHNFIQILNTGDAQMYANFNFSTGTVGNFGTQTVASITDVGNGWYRITARFTPGTFASTIRMRAVDSNTAVYGDTTSSTGIFYIWGADLRTGSSAGTYQRIAAATDYATAGFLPYLAFDGTDDSFGTNSIDFTATDKVSLFAGITKNSDAATGMVLELSNSVNIGSFRFAAPFGGAATNLYFESLGTLRSAATGTPYVAPITAVMTGLGDIPNDGSTLRVNGAVAATNTADQGTGNYGNYPLFIGRRNNSTLPFNGRIYQLIVCGKTLSASELASTEAYVNSKTGAY